MFINLHGNVTHYNIRRNANCTIVLFDGYANMKNTSFVTLRKKGRGTPSFFVPFTLKIATLVSAHPLPKENTNVDFQYN